MFREWEVKGVKKITKKYKTKHVPEKKKGRRRWVFFFSCM